jgi:hypothetical protein
MMSGVEIAFELLEPGTDQFPPLAVVGHVRIRRWGNHRRNRLGVG